MVSRGFFYFSSSNPCRFYLIGWARRQEAGGRQAGTEWARGLSLGHWEPVGWGGTLRSDDDLRGGGRLVGKGDWD